MKKRLFLIFLITVSWQSFAFLKTNFTYFLEEEINDDEINIILMFDSDLHDLEIEQKDELFTLNIKNSQSIFPYETLKLSKNKDVKIFAKNKKKDLTISFVNASYKNHKADRNKLSIRFKVINKTNEIIDIKTKDKNSKKNIKIKTKYNLKNTKVTNNNGLLVIDFSEELITIKRKYLKNILRNDQEDFSGDNFEFREKKIIFTHNYPNQNVKISLKNNLINIDFVVQKFLQKPVFFNKVSLNLQDTPIRNTLQTLAKQMELNIIISNQVQGNFSINLEDVELYQALDTILFTNKLDKIINKNIMHISTSKDIKEKKEALLHKEFTNDLPKIDLKYIPIEYTKAKKIADLLNDKKNKFLSKDGSANFDERTNIVIIKDKASNINEITQLIKRLDIEIKQVLIEARMVTIKESQKEEIGVRFGFSKSLDGQNSAISGTLEATGNITAGNIPNLSQRLNVALPATDQIASSFAWQINNIANQQILDLELSALETEQKAKIIASPKITAADNTRAYIEQGQEIPYVEAASSGAASVTFKKAVLGLNVYPQITPNEHIILNLKVTQNTPGDTIQTGTGLATAIDTQEIDTNILVKNKQTIVLGGIYQQHKAFLLNKTPILGDIPLLGFLFRNSREIAEKREVLIFVTPTIIE